MTKGTFIRAALLRWYRKNARHLPLRRTRDPYAILVAEVALQQTRIRVGGPFLQRFLRQFPTVEALASASEDEVLRAWEGLGYYRRARLLREAAREIVLRHRGKVPETFEALRDLPGVGPYTAGAVASIAFGLRVPAVDGNAARVLSRLFLVPSPVSSGAGLREYREIAARLIDPGDPGAFNQALMELGSLVCKPRRPRCGACPLSKHCKAFKGEKVAKFPPPAPRPALPEVAVAFALVERQGRVLAVRRGRGALLAGLWGLPGGEVRAEESPEETLAHHLGRYGLSLKTAREVDRRRKEFSSRVWDARVFACSVAGRAKRTEHARWFGPADRAKVPFVPFQRELIEARRP